MGFHSYLTKGRVTPEDLLVHPCGGESVQDILIAYYEFPKRALAILLVQGIKGMESLLIAVENRVRSLSRAHKIRVQLHHFLNTKNFRSTVPAIIIQ